MKKSMFILIAAASLLHAQEPGTMLLDDATSSTYVVTNAYQNAESDVKSDIQEEIGRFAETGMVDRANSANTAGNAAYAETAGTADTATHAQTSDTATSAETAQNANSAIYAESADVANEAELSRKAELLVNPEGSAYLELSAREIKDKLDSILSTNNVCDIVTNDIPYEFSEWSFAGLPDGWAVTNMEFVLDGTEFIPTEGYSGSWFATFVTNGFSWQIECDDLSYSWRDWVNFFISDNPVIYISATRTRFPIPALGLTYKMDLDTLEDGMKQYVDEATNGLIGADFISTNNAAFVTAVTNCPVAIATEDAEVLAEWGIYGGGGTIGALLAALAAAIAALKKKKMPLYPVGGSGNPVNATLESGVLTVSPFSMAAYAPTASAAFSVAMGALPSDLESGKARDAVLVIDCSLLSDGDEPTVTWGTNFHPRTDAGTDFACVAGAKNVYYISEYAQGEFAVGGWTETEGGSGS